MPPAFQPCIKFTAQSKNVRALYAMYGRVSTGHNTYAEFLPIVVFLAFTIEAYINSIGSRKIKYWDDLERLSWQKKVEILHKHVDRSTDWGQDPLQFTKEIFKLRDALAHGKEAIICGPVFDNHVEASKSLDLDSIQPKWFDKITRDWIIEARDRFQSLMKYLAALYGLNDSDYLHTSSSTVLQGDTEGPNKLVSGKAPANISDLLALLERSS